MQTLKTGLGLAQCDAHEWIVEWILMMFFFQVVGHTQTTSGSGGSTNLDRCHGQPNFSYKIGTETFQGCLSGSSGWRSKQIVSRMGIDFHGTKMTDLTYSLISPWTSASWEATPCTIWPGSYENGCWNELRNQTKSLSTVAQLMLLLQHSGLSAPRRPELTQQTTYSGIILAINCVSSNDQQYLKSWAALCYERLAGITSFDFNCCV